jgi:magnesium-protoporphyrin O-methyltransferase
MLQSSTYERRRGEIADYFDRTAAQAWTRLTSDAPVSRIRATVRAGRERMRATLLDWLPTDLQGVRILDAGCGTGATAVELAARGADVVAIDLAQQLVDVARERHGPTTAGRIAFLSGDMTDSVLGEFDHVIAMDSLIHYGTADAVQVLAGWSQRVRGTMLVTFAPATPALKAMHAVGRLFPRGDRAPSIVPVATRDLQKSIADHTALSGWRMGRSAQIASGFYTSCAYELERNA